MVLKPLAVHGKCSMGICLMFSVPSTCCMYRSGWVSSILGEKRKPISFHPMDWGHCGELGARMGHCQE